MSFNDVPIQTDQPADQPAAPRRRRRALVATLAAIPLLVGGGVAVASAHKTVELDVDGHERTVTTFAGSVDGLLDEQGIEPGEHDTVGPQPDEPLSDGAVVVVRTAQQVEVEINGEPRALWTTAETTGDAIHAIGEAGRSVTVAASRSLDGGRQALELPLVDGEPVDVVIGDETVRVTPDGEAEIDDILELAEVRLGKLDTVIVTTSNDGVVQLLVTRVSHQLVSDADAIPFDTDERQDDSLYVGETRLVHEGAQGRRVRAQLAVQAGSEESVGERSSYVTVREPVSRVVAVGTKERPVVRPSAPERSSSSSSSSSSSGDSSSSGSAASSSSSSGSSSSGDSSSSGGSSSSSGSSSGGSSSSSGGSSSGGSSSGGAVSGGVWASLAQCESGGNPSIVSSNGLYHGLYQFSVGTWQSVGGSGLPSQASPAEQTQRAQMLQARSGWGQWPACSAQLGLR